MSTVHIMGGGTFSHVRPHLALAAPAFGGAARQIYEFIDGSRLTEDAQGTPPAYFKGSRPKLWLTRMARGSTPGWQPRSDGDWITNEDVAEDLAKVVEDPETKVIFFSVALCDFNATVLEPSSEYGMLNMNWDPTPSGKDQPRLKTGQGTQMLSLSPAEKLIGSIRKKRKDIFLIGFKTTAGATPQEQYELGLGLLKKSSCNLVLANDLHTRLNMVVAPELARYHQTTNRWEALRGLVDMASLRHNLTYTRTVVEPGQLIEWASPTVPEPLRKVVDHCVARGAYKAFNEVTVGHFGFMPKKGYLYSSRRKQNYNIPSNRDLVMVEYQGRKLTAVGAKPSAGTTSQVQVLNRYYPEFDCIVHFHCPLKEGSQVTVRPQYGLECGSQECGQNTIDGMTPFGKSKPNMLNPYGFSTGAAVMLDQHGPNIIFNHRTDPEQVIAFIESNFDLTRRSGDD